MGERRFIDGFAGSKMTKKGKRSRVLHFCNDGQRHMWCFWNEEISEGRQCSGHRSTWNRERRGSRSRGSSDFIGVIQF